jgi:hypothetical protein
LILRTIATELVDMSKKAVSGRIPSINPFAPDATCSTSAGTGSEVKTISESGGCRMAGAIPLGCMAQPDKVASRGVSGAR